MSAYTSISTTVYSKAYLTKAWEARSDLTKYERRGFAQFFYSTIACHLEAVLAAHITARLKATQIFLKWDSATHMKSSASGVEKQVALSPVTDSIKRLLLKIEEDVRTATLEKLGEMYNRVFPIRLSEILGPNLNQDLKALMSIRNLIAHGRDFVMEFSSDAATPMVIDLDNHSLRQAAIRLKSAAIIESLDFNGLNHDEFQEAFYKDEALLYFYNVVKEIEQHVVAQRDFEPENIFSWIPPLPKLELAS